MCCVMLHSNRNSIARRASTETKKYAQKTYTSKDNLTVTFSNVTQVIDGWNTEEAFK